MMKIKLLTGLLAAALTPSVSLAINSAETSVTPKDPAIVNQERILYWMEQRGEIKPTATEEERQNAIKAYLGDMSNSSVKRPKLEQVRLQKNHSNYKSGQVLAQKNGQNTTVKVLAVLIDFPDLKHDAHGLTSSETDMYYSSYPVSHYQDLMFSTTGFIGPSGQNLTSGYQYYQNESGGTFNFTGQTYGWVTADNNAKYYGENDADTDNDKNVPELIKEAVTKAVAANNINLDEYDIEDPYDLNGNGNVNEPDGMIDHVMVYHSSIGEEAGGGSLASDAIWSHRFFVDTNTNGYTIPGTGKKLFGYTIQPIDAATGVVVHEFGHDLGVPDEYDTDGSAIGSPVGYWSVMAGGSWAGDVSGTQPTGFSPYARSYFQTVFGGNWINEEVINFDSMGPGSRTIDLVEAVNHNSGINQIRIDVPPAHVDFEAPYTGNYQYYSNEGHYMDNSLSFNANIPASGTTSLSMKARWDIEVDYDYAQVLVNGTAVAGNHTKATNQYHNVTNFITGASKDIAGAEGALGWVDLNFDLSAYAGQSVTIEVTYVTDPAVGGYGLVVDDIALNNGADFYNDGAETDGQVTLNGFLRVGSTKPGKPQNYWVQLRSSNGQDEGLANTVYTPGVLVWFADEAYSDNKVEEHPGHGFLGVVDADQNPVMRNGVIASSTLQVIDAAFGLYTQKNYSGDSHLSPTAKFDDSLDYSLPEQPQSGLVLPVNGLTIEVKAQASDSSTATVEISKASAELVANFNFDVDYQTVTFTDSTVGGDKNYSYLWDFGDGSAASTDKAPTHSYAQSGVYDVTLTVTDGEATVHSKTKQVSIADALQVEVITAVDGATVSVSSNIAGGAADYSYAWNFGDGTTSAEATGQHTYANTGDYTITLVVTSADKQQVESTKSVSVVAPMNASFNSSADGLKASFTSSVSGGDGSYSYAWNFGDGSSSTSASPSHTYAESGAYTVELKVTDSTGVEKVVTKSISVQKKSSGGGGSTSLWLILLLAASSVLRRKR